MNLIGDESNWSGLRSVWIDSLSLNPLTEHLTFSKFLMIMKVVDINDMADWQTELQRINLGSSSSLDRSEENHMTFVTSELPVLQGAN